MTETTAAAVDAYYARWGKATAEALEVRDGRIARVDLYLDPSPQRPAGRDR